MTCRIKSEQENQNRTELKLQKDRTELKLQKDRTEPKLQKDRRFAYLVMFIKLIFRQINNVCIEILSLLIPKMNNIPFFKSSDSYVIIHF